jgi:hypothetical protein
MFVRVVHRQGWDVETVDESGDESGRGDRGLPVRTENFASREEALARAREGGPDWIELGEVVPASGEVAQHHRWTTLRRLPDGSYAASGLSWGGGSGRGA